MRSQRRRAHILVVDDKTTISFATGAKRNGEHASNLGPKPVEEAWEEITAAGGRRPTAAELGGNGNGAIAQVSWNSPHLLVTGTSAAHALAVAAREPARHGDETIRHLARLSGCRDANAVDDLQAVLFGEPLNAAVIESWRRSCAMDEIDWSSEKRGLLDRQRCYELLDKLNQKMPPVPTPAEIYVIGGAAMALEYDATRQTEDVDVVIRRYGSEVLAAAEAIAAESPGLGADWLNQTAKAHRNLPTAADPDERTSYEGSRIRVKSAGAEWLLAMKIEAGREKDADDIVRLLKETGTRRIEDAVALHRRAFPGRALGNERRKNVETLLDAASGGDEEA